MSALPWTEVLGVSGLLAGLAILAYVAFAVPLSGTVSDPPPFNPDRIEWGQLAVNDLHLRDDLFFTIKIRCFNGTGRRIKLVRADGAISWHIDGSGDTAPVTLPQPRLDTTTGGDAVIKDRVTFSITLVQHVKKETLEAMLQLAPDQTLVFRLTDLKLIASTVSAKPEEAIVRLPNGVMLKKGDDRLRVDGWQLVASAGETVALHQR